MGGIAATSSVVVVGSRDPGDKLDLFQGFDAKTGDLLWQYSYPAEGQLDYGNSPRATPLILGPIVYTLGAFGDVACLDIEAGIPLWTKNYVRDFGGQQPQWGYSASLLAEGENLVVHPGGDTGLAVLDGITGALVWKAESEAPAYASPVFAEIDEKRFVIGMEAKAVVGWERGSGKSWRIEPKVPGDFGVPTPVIVENQLFLTSEGNGTRRHELSSLFTSKTVAAHHRRTAPDSHTPVSVGSQLLVAHNGLWGLRQSDLEANWHLKDRRFFGYASIIATEDRALVMNSSAQLLLLEFDESSAKVVSELSLSESGVKTLSHPALVGTKLFAQVGQRLICLELTPVK